MTSFISKRHLQVSESDNRNKTTFETVIGIRIHLSNICIEAEMLYGSQNEDNLNNSLLHYN